MNSSLKLLSRSRKVFSLNPRKMSSSKETEQVRSTTASGSQVYESKRAVHEYLMFHYGQESDKMRFSFTTGEALNFISKSGQLCDSFASSNASGKRRALDIGCAVGGTSFELAKHFEEVVGIDFSQHFIDAANQMKKYGSMDYDMLKQGKIFNARKAAIPSGIDRSRVSFSQGDACNLDPSLGKLYKTNLSLNCVNHLIFGL